MKTDETKITQPDQRDVINRRDAYISRVLSEAPPLTDEQAELLARFWRGGGDAS